MDLCNPALTPSSSSCYSTTRAWRLSVLVCRSVSAPADLNHLMEEWRKFTSNDKVEIVRQILRQWFDKHPLQDAAWAVLEIRRRDICHKINVDQADHPWINISNLKKVVHGGVTGSATAVDQLPHPPILVSLLSVKILMSHDHRLTLSYVQKDRALWTIELIVDPMVKRDSHKTRISKLVLSQQARAIKAELIIKN